MGAMKLTLGAKDFLIVEEPCCESMRRPAMTRGNGVEVKAQQRGHDGIVTLAWELAVNQQRAVLIVCCPWCGQRLPGAL